MPQLIRKGEAAALLGVSAPRVSQLLRAGHLSEVAGTGMLSREEVEQFAQSRAGLAPEHAQPQARITADQPVVAGEEALPPIAVSRQRLEALRVEIAQRDLDARNQKLVAREDVARAAFEEGRRVRQALEGLPFRLAHQLAAALGLDAEAAGFIVQEVMAAEIRALLISLSSDPEAAEDVSAATKQPNPD